MNIRLCLTFAPFRRVYLLPKLTSKRRLEDYTCKAKAGRLKYRLKETLYCLKLRRFGKNIISLNTSELTENIMFFPFLHRAKADKFCNT